MPDVRRKILVAFLVICAVILPLWPSFERAGLAMDEGALLVYPELIAKGQVPYRDFETFYGPANSWLLSAAYAVGGPSIFSERAVGLLYRILILTAIFALVQQRSTTLAAGSVVVAGLLLIPAGLPAYAWIGAVVCALWSLWSSLKVESARRCFCGGALAALALLFRPDFGPAMMAAGLPLFLLMPRDRRLNYLAGVALGLAPYAWVTFLAGPQELLNNLVLLPVFQSSAGRHVPIFSAPHSVIALFFLHLAAVGLNVVAGLIGVRRDRADASARLLLGLGLLALGVTHQAAQRLDFGHMLSAALLSLTILPVSIVTFFSQWRAQPVRPHQAFFASAFVVTLLQIMAPTLASSTFAKLVDSVNGDVHYAVFVEHRGRMFPIRSPQVAVGVDAMLNHLETLATPGQRLFVGPADLRRTNYNDTFIYHLMPQLQPATYFLEMNPLSANRPNSRLAADVATADWLILSHYWDDWKEPNDSMEFGSEAPMLVVQSQFQLCGRYEGYDLYRRRSPLAARN